MKLKFTHCYLEQDQDSCYDIRNDTQRLDVNFYDAGAGQYLVLSTERWALDPDDIDKFCSKLKEMAKVLK